MARNSSKPKSEYTIQTVANAFRMLEVFHSECEMGVSDLARRLKLHKNNAFRLLATLELSGYVQQCPETELYRLGPKCLELGRSFTRAHTLTKLARPVLEALCAETGETAHLGTLAGEEVSHLDAALPDQLVLTGSRVGDRLPAHCTAIGKVLLAGRLESPERVVEPAGLAEIPLESFTEATIVDRSKLLEEVRTARIQGYAVDFEEYQQGLCCVAAPIQDAEGRVLAAISLAGPSFRLGEAQLHGAARDILVEGAARLSRDLGALSV